MAWYWLDVVGNARGEYVVASAYAPELEYVMKREVVQLRLFNELAHGRGGYGLA